ncbi:YlcI/YnfO family protein [Pseudomarimonas arenosa]|uniref:Prevent-host-death protein n=1 Tax=Pseudomarimonas arenosa TaxID=2774145 RepID=A0AAW3ZN97_9GAMM|nr:YlcI/YnfO family protein [Pseudomarimonas arenosa]MBD8526662.1 prevent-host-death protein [Pseudomarimonas arenosa]
MKTSTIPALRVEPELREAAESMLREGETLSSFMEQSIRAEIRRRRVTQEFIDRGLRSQERARAGAGYVDADTVLDRLAGRLDAAKRTGSR